MIEVLLLQKIRQLLQVVEVAAVVGAAWVASLPVVYPSCLVPPALLALLLVPFHRCPLLLPPLLLQQLVIQPHLQELANFFVTGALRSLVTVFFNPPFEKPSIELNKAPRF